MTDFWVSEKELTDLKPLLPAALSEIGFADDGTVVSVAVNCLQRHLDAESMRKALDPLLDAGAERFLGVLKERIASVKTKKKLEPEPKRPREDLPPLIEPEHKEKKTRTERDSKDTRESRHRDDRERDRDRDRRDRDRDREREHRDRRDRDDRDKDRHSHRDRDRDHDDRKRRRDDDGKERSSSDAKKETTSSAASASATDAKPAGGEVKAESGAAGDAPKAPATDIKSRIAEALAKARKAKEAAAAGGAPAAAGATEAKAPNPNSSDAAERLAAMQARVAAQMRKIKGTELPSMPHILRVDEQGREVDSEGRVLQPSKKAFTATTLINKKLQRERVMKLLAPPSSITDPRKNPFYDPRLPGAGADSRRIKSRNAFVFKEAGTYVKAAQKLRAEAAKEQQIKEAATEGEKVPEEAAAAAKPARAKEPIPAIEWWDVPVMREESAPLQTKVAIPGDLGARSYETFIAEERITHYVEHPVPIEPAHELPPPPPRPLLMTKEERKKFRKKNRMEMQKEKRERQLLGLEPPPEPKVKISNLYRVLGTQAVADPSALEKMVREQMAARLQAHDQRNQERKLTPEERAEKKKKKLQEDTSKQVCACLFKVRRLVTLPRAKFKVDINAQQLYLTGCVLSCGDTTLVLVEGGPKNMKKYKTLLGRRIDWSEEQSAEKADGEGKKEGEEKPPAPAAPAAAKEPNLCELVWEGTLGRTTFRNFRFETFDNETAARKFLQDRGVGHLWDLGRAHVLGETPAILLD